MFTLRWSRSAAEFYDGLTENEAGRVDAILFQISADPFHVPGVKMLQGDLAGLRCRRVGSWRIIYEIEGNHLVDILVFADRKKAYV